MSKWLKTRVKKIGLPPGSLVPPYEIESQAHLTLFDFNAESFVEKDHATIEECIDCIDSPTMTWINIRGINNSKLLETIGHRFGLHSLILEDILNPGQRAKLDDYKTSLFIVMRVFFYDDITHKIEDEQISLVLGSNYVLSFLEGERDIFEPIRSRLRFPKSRMRNSGADYLCYALIDCIVDHYFLILEKIEAVVDTIDQEVFTRPTQQTLQKIQHLKREVLSLRKGVWPVREVISQMRRMESPLITETTKLYLHDVYDHTIQAVDTIESFRDIVSGMLEVYLSNISNRMNEIMKVLTIVSTTFVPLTFIASIYGMNFDHIPELHYQYGYLVVLCIMLGVFLCMLGYFRRKKWI